MSDETPEIEEHGEIVEPGGVDVRQVALLVGAIVDGDGRLIARTLAELHPADAADILEQLSLDQFRQAAELSPDAFTGEILAELSEDAREDAVEALPNTQLAQAIVELDTDDATLVVEDLPEEQREEVLSEMSERDRSAIEDALSFDEESAGRLTQREFVAAPEFWTVGDAIDHMRQAGEDDLPETFFEIYVVDPAFKPVGAVSLSSLMRKRREERLSEIMDEMHVLIDPEMDQEDAAYVFEKYRLAQAPVVDDAGRLKGILTIDDMVDVIQEENTEDLLALAGVNEASIASTALEQVKARAPWLFVNLGTAIGASFVIASFQTTIERVVALAILMPIVSALGGSAGTQTLAVVVRSLASRDLTEANTRRTIAREAGAALVNGLIFASSLAVVALIWFRDVRMAGVIAFALTLTFLWGGLAGILVPLGLKRLGADPAVASSVFVTATTDMVGFFLFLGLATVVLL